MNSPSTDIGIITALLQRLETDRLPELLRLKKKVNAGERLSDTDIGYLNRVFAEAKAAGLQPLIDRHPEFGDLVATLFSFYRRIVDRALENETHPKE